MRRGSVSAPSLFPYTTYDRFARQYRNSRNSTKLCFVFFPIFFVFMSFSDIERCYQSSMMIIQSYLLGYNARRLSRKIIKIQIIATIQNSPANLLFIFSRSRNFVGTFFFDILTKREIRISNVCTTTKWCNISQLYITFFWSIFFLFVIIQIIPTTF